MLRCQATTTEYELSLLLKRARTQPNLYLMLGVNKLSMKLQEVGVLVCGYVIAM